MAEITNTNGRNVIDYMARDYDSFLKSMRDLIPAKLPEWTDFNSESDFGNVLLELFAHMADILSYYQDRIANESFLGTAQTRRSIIQHLRLIGYRLSTAAPASAMLRLVVPVKCTDIITIRKGDAFATKSQKDKPSVRFEYTRDRNLVINCGTLPEAPDNPGKKYFDGIPVEEGRLIKNELLGISDGTANQRFNLLHSGLILRSLGQGQQIQKDIILLIKLGDKTEEWRLQESLALSHAEQKDFSVEIDENNRATIFFGDGEFGMIPSPGASIEVTYRVGGGQSGNMPKDSIQTIVDAPQLALLGATITNPDAATGGAERETIEHAVAHAPAVFRSGKRAVTADDYEALALDFKGVGKVRAEASGWNIVKLFVAPEGGGDVSDVLRANLLAYFEDKRHLATTIEIKDVKYVNIYVTAKIGVERFYPVEEIIEKVKQAAKNLLAFEKVDFGKPIYQSKFYEEIEDIKGVASVYISEFRRQPEGKVDTREQGKILLEPNEIPVVPETVDYAGGLKVLVESGD